MAAEDVRSMASALSYIDRVEGLPDCVGKDGAQRDVVGIRFHVSKGGSGLDGEDSQSTQEALDLGR